MFSLHLQMCFRKKFWFWPGWVSIWVLCRAGRMLYRWANHATQNRKRINRKLFKRNVLSQTVSYGPKMSRKTETSDNIVTKFLQHVENIDFHLLTPKFHNAFLPFMSNKPLHSNMTILGPKMAHNTEMNEARSTKFSQNIENHDLQHFESKFINSFRKMFSN